MVHKPHISEVSVLRAIALCAIVATVICFAPKTTAAQFGFMQTGYTLQTTPSYPAPGSSYTARIVGPTFDMSRGDISWTVNGVAQTESANQQEITLRAGELGQPSRIRVAFTAVGAPTTLEHTVMPSQVDIIVEGKTVVPSFYEGRRLPSYGSGVRFVAVPHLFSASGTRIPPENLLFRWSVNDSIVGEGRGLSSITTVMPKTGDVFLTLTVENVAGTVSHRSSFTLEPAESFVRFYEDNPLYGLARNAINNRFVLSDGEVTIKAEPYFVSEDILSNAQYNWTLNQDVVDNADSAPQFITLRKIGAGGMAEVGFSIRNLSSLLQYATGLFTIDFSDAQSL